MGVVWRPLVRIHEGHSMPLFWRASASDRKLSSDRDAFTFGCAP
jgi:hypothetical protein